MLFTRRWKMVVGIVATLLVAYGVYFAFQMFIFADGVAQDSGKNTPTENSREFEVDGTTFVLTPVGDDEHDIAADSDNKLTD